MMAKKNIRNLVRRGTALFLSLVMATSLLQLSAFAAPYKNQVMDGYYTIDAEGNIGTTTESSVTEDGFTLTKSIQQTGKDAFDITLTVETSETVTTSASKAATVLVIDLSNSMDYTLDNSTRLKEAKKVAKDFLASYAGTDANAQQYISVVWFGSGSGVDKEWVNVAGGAGKNSYDNIYTYLDQLEAPHSGDRGGTNLEAGLQTALEQLNVRKDIVEHKNVVLITDGKPTYRIGGGNGQDGSAQNNAAAAAQATAIKEADATLYTVCIAAEDDVCYEGTDIHICEHCEKTRDQHIREELCRNCGKPRDEHDSYRYWGRTYYTCPGMSNSYYNGQTSYYCDATKAQQYQDKVISGDVTVGYFLSNDIATSADTAFNAKTKADLEAALKAIAASIEINGMTGAGTTVTDPMGQFITLGAISTEATGKGVTASGSTLSWALDPEKAEKSLSEDGKTTTYTYSVTYPVTLDTAAEGFEEVNEDGTTKYYPANGYTYLGVPQADGSVKKIAFLVPGVCGEIPEMPWSVEYYLQDEAESGDYANYKLDDSKNFDPVDIWTTVSAPEGYAEKYSKDNYKFVSGSVELLITPDGENVMRLYYDYVTSLVTVNHWYKTNVWTAEGMFVEGEYSSDNMVTGSEQVRVNTEYTAVEQTSYNQGVYELVDEEPSKTITVALDQAENVIDLYYLREVDERAITSARVDHTYVTYGYELKNGTYEKVETGRVSEVAEQAAEIRATTMFNVSPAPLAEYEGYELNKDLGDYQELVLPNDTLGFKVVEDASKNVRELVFEKEVDERVKTGIVVEHYYTKNITEVDEFGAVRNYNDPDGVLGASEQFELYAGERFVAVEKNLYEGETYTSDASNVDKLVVEKVESGMTIKLYYSLSEKPEEAGVIANHYWRTYTDVTVELTEEVMDEATGETTTVVIGTDVVTRESINHKIEGIEYNDLYMGQKHTEAQKSWGEGYTYNAEESNPEVFAGRGVEANLYYDKFAEDDERSDADITVHHNYTTYLTTIVDGEVKTLTVKAGPVEEAYDGLKAGDAFTAVAQLVYEGSEYTQITDEAALSVVLQPGTNATIVINYEREASDLVDAAYTVDYEYRTYTMTVNEDGVAGYWDEPAVEYGEGISAAGYVGQKVSFTSGDREGFTPAASNPATSHILAAEGNDWTFVHEKRVPLGQAQVVVNHHYKTTTIAIDGSSSESSYDVLGTPVVKFAGEKYVAESAPNGFRLVDSKIDGVATEAVEVEITVTVTGETVVDFYYEKTIDNSVPASYSITHIYNYYTYDGELISSNSPAPTTGSGFVGNQITAEAEPNSYELVSATYNGSEMSGSPYTFFLQDGSNNVVLTYEKYEPRAKVPVTVIHNYYQDEAALAEGTKKASFQETISEVDEDSIYTAETLREEDQGLVYEYHSANPENRTITVVKDGENVIVINYIRQIAEYKVIHRYYANGELEGSVGDNDTISGYVGDEVKGESIERIPTFGENEYQFTGITEDIVLAADAVKAIVLSYNRTVYIPIPQPGISIEKTAVQQIVRGNAFDYTLKVTSTGDADATNVVVTDVLPAGVELLNKALSENDPYTYDAETRTIRWEIGTLEIGASVELKFEVVAVESGNVKNVAVVEADGDLSDEDEVVTIVVTPDPGPDPTPDPDPDPIVIPDEPTPLAPAPVEEPIEILDEEVPLANVPKTGDISALWYAMSAISGLGMLGLAVTGKKKEEEI